ncbi:porin family protein [Vibrio sp. Isolate23]|uniref:outer membrane beta-barrel protein n=1 Tax=Vibrio sp. Isolate23 TaxID=2908533 RepID=UPI001EFD9652|nr:outer membrane beta-barrel protein [Vibrio sp. Isolate23]MCG9683617.1 porin family protein [Vibrio sp. Isolate23]
MFKTKLKALAITSLFIAPLATANPYFMGLELSGGKFNTKFSTTEDLSSDDPALLESASKDLDSKTAIRLVGGKYLNDNIRVYGFAQTDGEIEVTKNVADILTTKASYKSYEIGAGADYLHFFNKQFFAVAGASLGYYSNELKADAKIDLGGGDVFEQNNKSSNSGLVTSINLGLGYNFTDSFGMEGGYRLSHYSGNDHTFNYDDEGYKWSETVSFKSSNQFYVNATYKF